MKVLLLSKSLEVFYEVFRKFSGGTKEIESTVKLFEQLAVACTKQNMADEAKRAITAIYCIGKQMIKLKNPKEITKVFDALKRTENAFIEKKPAHLKYLIEIYSELMCDVISNFSNDSMTRTVENGSNYEQCETLEKTKEYIEDQIQKEYTDDYCRKMEGFREVKMASYLESLGRKGIANNIPWVTEVVIKKLSDLKRIAKEKSITWAVEEITQSLKRLNEIVEKSQQKNPQ